ncbi:MAG: hypothetical protein JNL88_05010 [Bacteroidia bacterium]|nr:hypothetical protein [Bacteroidia bacterium]
MTQFLPAFVLLPLCAFLLCLLVPRGKEKLLSSVVMAAGGLQFLLALAFTLFWWSEGRPVYNVKSLVLYASPDFEFFLDFYFDKVTAVFALTGAALTFLVAVFSRYYMHREPGFKRYFCTIILFFTGYNFVVFSGNLETLFVGWEMLGITSFLLIAFYRDRHLPVRNGFKVLSFYRLSDVCLILAMWMSHHLWHKNITYAQWNETAAVQGLLQNEYLPLLFVSLMMVIAAMLKSAQMPFFTWLPRAMEGPTTSSAIFYGSLSVHIGVFLLLRTYPLWESDTVVKTLVLLTGALTALVAGGITRVQATVKTQIAYASVAQIGLMFIEVALGFHLLALFHFAGNAFLRTYQLLVSPSVLSYKIHNMFFSFSPSPDKHRSGSFNRLRTQWYLLSLKEWNLDHLLHRHFWFPFKWAGKQLNYLFSQWSILVYLFLMLVSLVGYFFRKDLADHWTEMMPLLTLAVSLILLLMAFAGRAEAQRMWLLVVISQVFTAMALIWNSHIELHRLAMYLSGTFTGAVVGLFCLYKITEKEGQVNLHNYHGYAAYHPHYAFFFLLSCLALVGFPLTPTFVGIDLMFMSVSAGQPFHLAGVALNFLLLELTLLRIYCRVFLGQDKKHIHPVAYKSS